MEMSGRPVSAAERGDNLKPGTAPVRPHRALTRRFSGFALISGMGWCLDFVIMATLTHSGVPVFWANFFGAFCGVTFVFFIAGKHIFRKAGDRTMATLLLLYWIWQLVAVTAASALTAGLSWSLIALLEHGSAVQVLSEAGINIVTLCGVSAKILVTPLTLIANFFFMRFLLETRRPE